MTNYQLAIQLLKKEHVRTNERYICSDILFDDLGIFRYNGIIDKIINTAGQEVNANYNGFVIELYKDGTSRKKYYNNGTDAILYKMELK